MKSSSFRLAFVSLVALLFVVPSASHGHGKTEAFAIETGVSGKPENAKIVDKIKPTDATILPGMEPIKVERRSPGEFHFSAESPFGFGRIDVYMKATDGGIHKTIAATPSTLARMMPWGGCAAERIMMFGHTVLAPIATPKGKGVVQMGARRAGHDPSRIRYRRMR